MPVDPSRDQAPYSEAQLEGMVAGEYTRWAGARRKRFPATSWYELRGKVERTGRIDPGPDAPDAEAFLEVMDLERALNALNRKDEAGDPSEPWRAQAAMVLRLRMEGFTYEEISAVWRGENVWRLSEKAIRWIKRYLSPE